VSFEGFEQAVRCDHIAEGLKMEQEVIQYHWRLSKVTKLASDQFNDQRVPGL
jgi:hypothetical protein